MFRLERSVQRAIASSECGRLVASVVDQAFREQFQRKWIGSIVAVAQCRRCHTSTVVGRTPLCDITAFPFADIGQPRGQSANEFASECIALFIFTNKTHIELSRRRASLVGGVFAIVWLWHNTG